MSFAQLKPIQYKDGTQNLNGFQIAPEKGNATKPGVLILPAWMGIDALSKDTAKKLSNMGYFAFVADIYGEGEIVVNSEHRKGIQKLGKGLKITATALDGVVEGIESNSDDWYAVGVQWHPGSGTASGLDIQVFRGLVDAARDRAASKVMVKLAA